MQHLVGVVSVWRVLPWDEQAAEQFTELRSQRARVGTMDLKIASIAMTHDALLLTGNTRDFERLSGLRFDDWLSP